MDTGLNRCKLVLTRKWHQDRAITNRRQIVGPSPLTSHIQTSNSAKTASFCYLFIQESDWRPHYRPGRLWHVGEPQPLLEVSSHVYDLFTIETFP